MILLPEGMLSGFACRFGGTLRGADARVRFLRPVHLAEAGDLAPFLSGKYRRDAELALGRGACVLAVSELAVRLAETPGGTVWVHPHAAWVLAGLLDSCVDAKDKPRFGVGCTVGAGAVVADGVVIGDRVCIGAGAVIGHGGFGWVSGPDGAVRAMPQLGGVLIEDDVWIGAHCTVDSGTLGPTFLGRGVKLDAQVHVGHNVEIGEGTMVAAQAGFAGSVRVGRYARVGGQAGIADHVRIGDFARIAAKSGVIGDVPAHGVVAGYPAVEHSKWLRALGYLYRGLSRPRVGPLRPGNQEIG